MISDGSLPGSLVWRTGSDRGCRCRSGPAQDGRSGRGAGDARLPPRSSRRPGAQAGRGLRPRRRTAPIVLDLASGSFGCDQEFVSKAGPAPQDITEPSTRLRYRGSALCDNAHNDPCGDYPCRHRNATLQPSIVQPRLCLGTADALLGAVRGSDGQGAGRGGVRAGAAGRQLGETEERLH